MAASEQYGNRYIVIGVPSGSPDDIAQFIEERDVASIPHIVGTNDLWDHYGVRGSPSWLTVTVSGEASLRVGAMSASMFRGEWAE